MDPACGTGFGVTSNDLAGEPTMFAPEYTASLTLDYAMPLSKGMEVFSSGEVNYRDDLEPGGDNDPIDGIDEGRILGVQFKLRF